MPQASETDRERYRAQFGDLGCEHAQRELESRGYVLTDCWEWRLPNPEHEPTDEELFWLGFLVDEWDYGGWAAPPTEEGRE